MTTRTDFYNKYRPYWEAETPQQGLKDWSMSMVHSDTRTCVVCEEEYPLEEFWTGYKLSHACGKDRSKLKAKREKLEKSVSEENAKESKGPVSGIKEKAAGKAKAAVAKPVGKAAGATVKKATSNLAGDEVGEVAGKVTTQAVEKLIA